MVESVTSTVKLYVPDAVGVPEIAPLAGVILNPEGRDPALTLQLYGVVPPLAASVALYAVPCCPLGSELVLMLTAVASEFIVRLKACAAV